MRHPHTLIALCFISSHLACAAAQPSLPDPPPAQPAEPTPLPLDREPQISEYVREVFQDREGNLWFGTNGEGVCRFDGASLTFFTVKEGFVGTAVRGIVQDKDGAMWFATDWGISRYESGAFTNYRSANGLSADSAWSMMLDKSGAIWVGTHEGVCRFDGTSFVPFDLPRIEVENPESRFTPNVVFAMIEDSAGNLWFGTDGEGVHKYDGKSFTSYTAKDGLAGNLVRSLREDRRGRIWIGTDGGGVSCFDGKTFQTFTTKDGLGTDRVYEILEDRDGNMWFSTLGAGACRYDGTTFKKFGVDQGLSVNELACACGSGYRAKDCHGPGGGHVQEILQDTDGNLWFGCSGGLFRLENERFINVTRNGPWPKRTQPTPAQLDPANPIAPFSRMIPGEWRITFDSGTKQFVRWAAGPGNHSIHAQTYGTDAVGDPWRSLSVFYWHPQRKQIRTLGLHQDIPGIGRGVSEGSITFDAQSQTADARFDLSQSNNPRGTRKLGLHWAFSDPNHYDASLLEDGGRGYKELVEWHFARSVDLTPFPPVADAAAKPSGPMSILAPLIAHAWQATDNLGAAGPLPIHTTFEWIPYCQAVHARIETAPESSIPIHILDAYLFRDVKTDALRCLALANRGIEGSVYEGRLTALDGGALQLDLHGHDGDAPTQLIVRLDFEGDETLRSRIWTTTGDAPHAQRTLQLDILNTKLAPK